MLTEEQVEHQCDRAIVRCRQYKRSAMPNPMLVGDLGQYAGLCAIDRKTGEVLPDSTPITDENVYFRLGKSIDPLRLMQELRADSFEGLVAMQNSALQSYMWTNEQILELVADDTLKSQNIKKLRANIRARSLDPKVKVGGGA